METVGAYEAKTHLPRLLQKVAKGETITITRHGIPVAVLCPLKNDARVDAGSVIKELQDFRKGKKLSGSTIRDMIEEGRR